MAAPFYLRDSVVGDATLDTAIFSGHPRARTLPGGTPVIINATPRSLSLSAGAAVASVAGAGAATIAHQDNLMGIWVSPPLASQSLAGGVWSIALGVLEGGALGNANAFLALAVYLYRPIAGWGSSGITIPIYDSDTPLGNEWPITNAEGRVVTFVGIPIPDVTFGDRLVLEVWQHAIQGTTGPFTNTVYFNGPDEVIEAAAQPGIDGDPASALAPPSTLALAATTDPNAQVSQPGGGRASGHGSIEERWYYCGRCGKKYPESQTVILQIPHTSAGLRVCTQYCADDEDYEMRQYGWTPPVEHDPPEEV